MCIFFLSVSTCLIFGLFHLYLFQPLNLDHLDESLVFLRRLHCWSESDIVSQAPEESYAEAYKNLAGAVDDFSRLDAELFKRLNLTFTRKVC